MKLIAKNGDTLAPCELAQYWKEHRAKADFVDDKMEELQEQYSVKEVGDIFNREFGDSDDRDIDAQMAAVDITGNILQKRYNLHTARLIGSYSSDLPPDDNGYYEERLYQQDTGAFFLVGHGGWNTKYSRTSEFEDEPIRGGKCTFSISIAEAKEWIAEHQDG